MGTNVFKTDKVVLTKRTVETDKKDRKKSIKNYFENLEVRPLSMQEINNARIKVYEPICI